VYFAERRQSIGFDWHRQCLKCEECGKVLIPGQHAEHKERPYCHIPCYSALFGPILFGHGSRIESHQSFGKRAGKLILHHQELVKKVKHYNDHMENNGASRLVLTSREVNDRLVIEGVLRIFWSIQHSIRVKEEHDQRPIIMRRKSSSKSDQEVQSDANFNRHSVHQCLIGTSKEFSESLATPKAEEFLEKSILKRTLSDSKLVSTIKSSTEEFHKTLPNISTKRNPSFLEFKLDRFETSLDLPQEEQVKIKVVQNCDSEPDLHHHDPEDQENKVPNEPEQVEEIKVLSKSKKSTKPRALRRRHGRKYDKSTVLKRKSSFNGHWYDRDSSVFTPPKNSIMSLWVTSFLTTADILKMLLDKYQIESEHTNYGLFLVFDYGERRLLLDSEFPLIVRVKLGPHEDLAKFQLMELKTTVEIKPEVAQFLRFTYAECRAIVDMFYEEEEKEIERIKRKYRLRKRCIQNLMNRKLTENSINQ